MSYSYTTSWPVHPRPSVMSASGLPNQRRGAESTRCAALCSAIHLRGWCTNHSETTPQAESRTTAAAKTFSAMRLDLDLFFLLFLAFFILT